MVWRTIALVFAIISTTLGSHTGTETLPGDCLDNIRLGIAIDVAGQRDLLQKVSEFIKELLGKYHIGPNQSRVGVITYAYEAQILVHFQDVTFQSLQEAEIAIDEVVKRSQPQERSMTERALMKAHDDLFSGPSIHHHLQTLVVFALGRSPNPQLYEDIVGNLEDSGVNIVAVSWHPEENALIAGKRGHVISVDDVYDAIHNLPRIVEATCTLNGGYTQWSGWSTCSVTCGAGQETRTRSCSNPTPTGTGRNCDGLGPAEDSRSCNNQSCGDIDGGYTSWSEWSVCSHTCGAGGVTLRERLCINPLQQNNGTNCSVLGPALESKSCNSKTCGFAALGEPCKDGLDMGLLVDQSKSIRPNNLLALLNDFLPWFIELFDVSMSRTRVAVVRFSKTSHFEFNLADQRYHSRSTVKNGFSRIRPITFRHTRIDRGLLSVNHELFTTRAGDRRSKQNVLVVFTDGRPHPEKRHQPFNETIPPLTDGKEVHMVAVGYGVYQKINRSVLEEIAGDNVVVMRSRTKYKDYINTVKEMVCMVDGGYSQWSAWTLCSESCGTGVRSRSRSCTAPPRRKGGKDCQGDHFEASSCSERPCMQPPAQCDSLKLDLAVVLDVSSHLGAPHVFYSTEFINKLFHLFDITPDETRVSLVLFDKSAHQIISFKYSSIQTNERVEFALRFLQLTNLQKGKRLDKALEYVDSYVFTSEGGDRPNTKNAAVFITDGMLPFINGVQVNITDTVKSLRDEKHVNMVTVGVGTDIQDEVLYDIAETKVVLTSSYQDFLSKVEHVAALACTI